MERLTSGLFVVLGIGALTWAFSMVAGIFIGSVASLVSEVNVFNNALIFSGYATVLAVVYAIFAELSYDGLDKE